jgi:hypothetical protein
LPPAGMCAKRTCPALSPRFEPAVSPLAREGLQRKSRNKPQKRFARNWSGKPGPGAKRRGHAQILLPKNFLFLIFHSIFIVLEFCTKCVHNIGKTGNSFGSQISRISAFMSISAWRIGD